MSAPTISELRAQVRGGVIKPTDPGYDEGRQVFNAMHDRRPSAIVLARDVADVQATIRYASERGLDLAVRGGGAQRPRIRHRRRRPRHRPVGHERRPRRPGRAHGACRGRRHLGRLRPRHPPVRSGHDRRDHLDHRRRRPDARRRHRLPGPQAGLSIDNLLSADVVLADGRQVTASEDQHEDLFWALRGRRRQLRRRHRASSSSSTPWRRSYGGPMFYEVDDAATVMEFYREFIDDGARATRLLLRLADRSTPAVRSRGPGGRLFCALVACGPAPTTRPRPCCKPFHEVAEIKAPTWARPIPGAEQRVRRLVPKGLQHYWKADFVSELTDEAITAHVEHGKKTPCVNSTMHLYSINGAAHRVGADETAFGHRDKKFAPVIAGMWPDPADNDGQHQVGEGLLRRDPPALGNRRRLHQLHVRRRWRPGAGELRRQLPTPGRGQGRLRPRERLPHQPEHQTQA